MCIDSLPDNEHRFQESDSEPLRFDGRGRQASAILRSRLLHLRPRFRSLADHSRFQSARSVTRPEFRNANQYAFQYFSRNRLADAAEHPCRRDDVPRPNIADLSRLLFRYERRRCRQTSDQVIAEQRPPHFPLCVFRRLAADAAAACRRRVPDSDDTGIERDFQACRAS